MSVKCLKMTIFERNNLFHIENAQIFLNFKFHVGYKEHTLFRVKGII